MLLQVKKSSPCWPALHVADILGDGPTGGQRRYQPGASRATADSTREGRGGGCATRKRPMMVAPTAKAKLASYTSAKPRSHRTHGLGDRALPEVRADAAAADPGKR